MEDITFSITKVDQHFKIITLLKDILSNTNIEYRPNGIYGNTMTDSKIGLVEFFIPKEALLNYTDTKSTKTIGINLSSYHTILKCIGIKSPQIDYTITNETMNLSTVGARKSNISMYLLDIDSDVYEPDSDYSSIVKMDSKELYSVIKDLNDLGDEITITLNKNNITFGTDDISIAKTNFTFEKSDTIEIDCDEEIVMKYTGKEFLKYTKAYTFASNVSLYFSPDSPLTLHYISNDNFGWFRMFLAQMSE